MPRNPLLKGLRPVHPGEHLREDVLPALGKSKAEIARLLGVSRQTLYDVLNERQPITANLAPYAKKANQVETAKTMILRSGGSHTWEELKRLRERWFTARVHQEVRG